MKSKKKAQRKKLIEQQPPPIEEWEKKYEDASSWLGKWYCQTQIDKWKKKLHHYK